MHQNLRCLRRFDTEGMVVGHDSDHVLVQRFKSGDEQAFNELVLRHQNRVYNLALRMVRGSEDAEDICQEVFVKAYHALERFREDSTLYTWLYRITVNYCVNHLRRNKVRETVLADYTMRWRGRRGISLEEELARGDMGAAVKNAIDKLPPKQRAVFLLRQYEGLSHKEIGEVLKRSVGAVKANYFHAVKRLQRELTGFERYMEEGGL